VHAVNTFVEVDIKLPSLLTSVLESSRPHSWGGWMDALEKRKICFPSVFLPVTCSLYWLSYYGSFF